MERFVRLTAPTNWLDFTVKLCVFLLICGGLNHARDVIQHGFADRNSFLDNFVDASFTALPMCSFALLLIGHLQFLQKQLYEHATQDLLTGLHNRRWFMEQTSEDLKPCQALLIIDVDHFKTINDTFGHDVGDRCLVQVAKHLKATIRKTDYCARIGGEEFAIILHDADMQSVCDIAGRLSAGFLFDPGTGPPRQITTSVGVSFDSIAQPRVLALKLADEAAYRAKGQGRAQYVLSSSTMDTDIAVPHTAAG